MSYLTKLTACANILAHAKKTAQGLNMRVFSLLLLSFTFFFSQSKPIMPKLSFDQVLMGNKSDIGFWGDGKIYIIDLWGTWCSPCIKNMPKLTQLQKRYKKDGLIIIGYSWEDPSKINALIQRMGDKLNFYLVNELNGSFMKILAEEKEMIEGFPYSFVIDDKGKLIWKGHPKDDHLETFIHTLFDKRKVN